MLSLQRCREILGTDSSLSDSDLQLLRDQLYALGRATVEALPRQPRTNGSPRSPEGFAEALSALPEDDRYELQERAAIAEFDGGLERSAAEQAAFSEFWRTRHRGRLK
jgi:hypothetical protein